MVSRKARILVCLAFRSLLKGREEEAKSILASYKRRGGDKDSLRIFDEPRLGYFFEYAKEGKEEKEQHLIDISDEIVFLNEERAGKIKSLYMWPKPVDERLYVSYSIMYDSFLKFLYKRGFSPLNYSHEACEVFVPEGKELDIKELWTNFLDEELLLDDLLIRLRSLFDMAPGLGMGWPGFMRSFPNEDSLIVMMATVLSDRGIDPQDIEGLDNLSSEQIEKLETAYERLSGAVRGAFWRARNVEDKIAEDCQT